MLGRSGDGTQSQPGVSVGQHYAGNRTMRCPHSCQPLILASSRCLVALCRSAAAVYSIQGQRSHMEDNYYADHSKGFFAVYGRDMCCMCERIQHFKRLFCTDCASDVVCSMQMVMVAPAAPPMPLIISTRWCSSIMCTRLPSWHSKKDSKTWTISGWRLRN